MLVCSSWFGFTSRDLCISANLRWSHAVSLAAGPRSLKFPKPGGLVGGVRLPAPPRALVQPISLACHHYAFESRVSVAIAVAALAMGYDMCRFFLPLLRRALQTIGLCPLEEGHMTIWSCPPSMPLPDLCKGMCSLSLIFKSLYKMGELTFLPDSTLAPQPVV